MGITFFFIFEAIGRTPEAQSGLRFTTILRDMKKPGVLIWVLLPVASAIGSIMIGSMLFENQYIDHVLGRTSTLLSFDKIPLLVGQLIIGSLGEEIAF